jgi:P-type conjugative transfer protein TrbJ
MSTPSSTRSPTSRWPRNRAVASLAVLLIAAGACSDPKPATAQQIVFDPKSYAESALHTAHQLESLANEAKMLANQAHALAASPYSHLAQTNQTLREITDLAQTVRGVAANVTQLESQFQSLYPTAVQGADPRNLLQQAQSRAAVAHDTAQDLARVAAELERLSQTRGARVSGALTATQAAQGPTAAIQASAQLLGAMSEDMSSLRGVALAQARLMAEEAASRAADRAAGDELHRQLWAHDAGGPANPNFNPLPHARN